MLSGILSTELSELASGAGAGLAGVARPADCDGIVPVVSDAGDAAGAAAGAGCGVAVILGVAGSSDGAGAGLGAIRVCRSTAVGAVRSRFDGVAASDFRFSSLGAASIGGSLTLDFSAAGWAGSPPSR